MIEHFNFLIIVVMSKLEVIIRCPLLQICFAYRGAIREYISFKLSYSVTSSVWRWYPFVREAISYSKWRHVCMNLYEKITSDPFIKKRTTGSTVFKMSYIHFMRDPKSTDDYFVDDFSIGSSVVMGKCHDGATNASGSVATWIRG